MAIYQSLGIGDASFIADADLTDWQFRFVTVASTVGNVKKSTGASNPMPVGVLQNSPSAGQEARVTVLGFSKLVGLATATCDVRWGKFLGASNGGQGYVHNTGTGSAVQARWLDANVTSGSAIGQAFIFGIGFATCAIAAS